jgi:hypothetical protein
LSIYIAFLYLFLQGFHIKIGMSDAMSSLRKRKSQESLKESGNTSSDSALEK